MPLACMPDWVTPVSFDPSAMAARGAAKGAGQQEPMRVALHPRDGEIPWPERLAHPAGARLGAEPPPSEGKASRTQRRRAQRKLCRSARARLVMAPTGQGAPRPSDEGWAWSACGR
ncbi:unnamed protein product [Prorocentrum cordatum]|uniref:Uncharacterized protein n=1 Tax=Prorocentrum cordatum TaxID=2364126 RepID=A0ABN9QK36_9DINO|nr:unnamed protein product [Polarella glacialis]